jgi:hypothetical protein
MNQTPLSEFRAAAARRFPYSARQKTITGDGRFALALKCTRPTWSILLFQTRAERDNSARLWFQHCEHHSNCRGALHERIEFDITSALPVVPVPTVCMADRFPDKYDKD